MSFCPDGHICTSGQCDRRGRCWRVAFSHPLAERHPEGHWPADLLAHHMTEEEIKTRLEQREQSERSAVNRKRHLDAEVARRATIEERVRTTGQQVLLFRTVLELKKTKK